MRQNDLAPTCYCQVERPQKLSVSYSDGVGGTLAPGQVKDFPYTAVGFIWNNTAQDTGALYDGAGHLVSYWVDQ